MIVKRHSRLRTQALALGGELIMDFTIINYYNQIHIFNATPPGAYA
tara:strand:+ start:1042 stop:1179 length:138 start_codon:yes stop_codon:yes gene_type:complete